MWVELAEIGLVEFAEIWEPSSLQGPPAAQSSAPSDSVALGVFAELGMSVHSVNGTEMSRTLSPVSTDAAQEGKGIQATTAQASLDPLLPQACIPIWILFCPWNECRAGGQTERVSLHIPS